MKIEYEIIQRTEIDESVRTSFAAMLRKQGKVKGDLLRKADRCKLLCVVKVDSEVIAIGGIKQKTASDFTKAGMPESFRTSSTGNWDTCSQIASTLSEALRQMLLVSLLRPTAKVV